MTVIINNCGPLQAQAGIQQRRNGYAAAVDCPAYSCMVAAPAQQHSAKHGLPQKLLQGDEACSRKFQSDKVIWHPNLGRDTICHQHDVIN